jgi:hypothetical protein
VQLDGNRQRSTVRITMFGIKRFGHAKAKPVNRTLRFGASGKRRWHADGTAGAKSEADCAPLVSETPIERLAMFGIDLLNVKEDKRPSVIDESTGRQLVLPHGVVKLRAPARDVMYNFGEHETDESDPFYGHSVEWMSTYPIPVEHLPEISWVYRNPIIPASSMTRQQLAYDERRQTAVAWAEARELKRADSEERREGGFALGVKQEIAHAAMWRLEQDLITWAPDPAANPLAGRGDSSTYAESYALLYGEVLDPPWAEWQDACDGPEYDSYKVDRIVRWDSYGAPEYNLTDAE